MTAIRNFISEFGNIGFIANQTGIAIQEMSGNQQRTAFKGLLLQISVISGCPIPTDERYAKLLENEVIRFLTEHHKFRNLTVEEILTAFRFNSAGKFDDKVNHYQNLFNLDYLGQILLNWLPIKNRIEAKVKKELAIKNIYDLGWQSIPENKIIDHCKAEWIRTNDFMFIKASAYDLLSTTNEIKVKEEDKERIKEQADIKMREISSLDCMIIYGASVDVRSIISRKIAVAEYFNGAALMNEKLKSWQLPPVQERSMVM